MEMTKLERAVVDAICAARPDDGETLRALFTTAKVTRRDNTGHGFYTYFEFGSGALSFGDRMINGPIAYMRDMGAGMTMGFVIWPEDDTPACMEGYQNCDDNGDTVDLKSRDLASLEYDRFEWF